MTQNDEHIFHEARRRPAGPARAAYLDKACGPDAELRALVEALLKADTQAGVFLQTGEDAASASDATVRHVEEEHTQADAAPSAETPGSIIGRYKLLQSIGEGGFGTVWMAEQREPVIRKVALKIIKLGMDTRQVIARFEAERQALALMDHPNIAKVLDAGATDRGRPFFVMELCVGDSITSYCDRNSLSIPERLELFAQVCQAVQHAHQKGLIHRDIKPSNILVATQDGRPNAKVIDFGIAKATASRLTEKTLFTEHRQLIGTPQYMSPEQAEGNLDLDTRTDVYSLGVLLYELLTGVTPFDPKKLRSADFGEIQRIIREDEPPKPSTRLSQQTATLATIAARRRIEPKRLGMVIRGELDWVVMKCLEKDRQRRYETANGLATDIRRYLAGETVMAAPASRTYRLRKFVQRNRVGVFAGTLLAAALVLGVIGTTAGLLWALDEKSRAALATRAESRAKRAAEENAAAAMMAAEKAERAAYQAQMMSAANAIEDQRTEAAADLLSATSPALRGWEHRLLTSRLNRSLPTPFPPAWRVTGLRSAPGVVAVRRINDRETNEWVILDNDLRTQLLVVSATEATAVWDFAVSPDGTRVVAVTENKQFIELWNIAARKAIARIPARPITQPDISRVVSWTPDGSRFAVSDCSTIELFDGRTGESIRRSDIDGWAQFTADSRFMFLYGSHLKSDFDARTYRLLDAETLEPRSATYRFEATISGGSVTFWQSRIACSLEDGTFRVLEIQDDGLREYRRIAAGIGVLESPAWSHDGRMLAVGSLYGRVRAWELESGTPRGEFAGPQFPTSGLLFQRDSGDLLACDLAGNVRLWPVGSASSGALTAHRSFVYATAVSNDGGMLITGGWDGASGFHGGLKLWDARTGTLLFERGQPGDVYWSVDFTPDRRYVVAGIFSESAASPRTEVIELNAGTIAATFRPLLSNRGQPERTVVHPDGQRVISTYAYGEVYAWELRTGRILWQTNCVLRTDLSKPLMAHPAAALSPDGQFLAIADERDIRLISMDNYAEVRRWNAHAEGLWSLSFGPNGKWLLSSSYDDTVGVWDVSTGARIARLAGHNTDVLCAVMSPDGTRIASGGRDRYVRLWDTMHFENVAQLGGHKDYIYSLAWNPDGRQLYSSSGDSTVRIWDTRTLAEQVEGVRARSETMPAIEAQVAQARAHSESPAAALDAVLASPNLDARGRELARQAAARFALRGMPAYYRAPRAAKPVIIDGKLDDAGWSDAQWSSLFIDIEGDAKPKPRFETRMRMCWDDANLYVAATLQEPHVSATLKNRDDHVLRDHDFEVFLDPEGDGRWYGEVEVNALSTIFDLRLDRPYAESGHADHDWSPPGMRAAVSIDGTLNDPTDIDRGWTVEIAIPHVGLADHAGVPMPPRPGDIWRINFSRVEWQYDVVDGQYVKRPNTPEDNWVWSPQHVINMHVPKEWGFVEFEGARP